MNRIANALVIALIAGAVTLGSELRAADSAVAAETKAPPKEAAIPFVRFGNVNDFEADGDSAVWLQARNRQWYHAELWGPCQNLPFVQGIGVEARGVDQLDRFGALIVDGQRCQIRSLTKSAPPPGRQSHRPAPATTPS